MIRKKDARIRIATAFLCLFLFSACAGSVQDASLKGDLGPGPGDGLERVRWWNIPDFPDDLSVESLIAAGKGSLEYYAMKPPNKTYRFGRDVYTADELKRYLGRFLLYAKEHPGEKERRKFLKETSRIYRGGGEKRKVLFTGYFEPVLEGSTLPGVVYNVPIYALPKDMITVQLGEFLPAMKGKRLVGRYLDGELVPYYTRHEIDRQEALAGRGYELAWVKDPVEAFFLQIQGSGKILLADGSVMNLHYAGSNGRPYRSIGQLLARSGKMAIEDVTVPSIKQYLKDHPEESEEILDFNESYVFFEEVPAGAIGSLGLVLTPERSVATDPACYPPGALAYVETDVPEIGGGLVPVEWKKAGRFVLNQDTGGALKGPGRADLFFGTGDAAGDRAGLMKHSGKIYFFAPKKAKPALRE